MEWERRCKGENLCREYVNKEGWGNTEAGFFLAEKGGTTYAGAVQLIYTLLDLSLQYILSNYFCFFLLFKCQVALSLYAST